VLCECTGCALYFEADLLADDEELACPLCGEPATEISDERDSGAGNLTAIGRLPRRWTSSVMSWFALMEMTARPRREPKMNAARVLAASSIRWPQTEDRFNQGRCQLATLPRPTFT
jgi:hypothetical protein